MRNIAPILMSVLFLAILAGANIYLSRRVAWIFSLDSRTWLHILFAVLPVFMVGGMVGFSNSTSLAGTILYGTAAIVTGLVLYLLLAFLATDLLRLFVPLKPALFGVIAFSLAVGVTAYGLWNATRTQVTRLEVAVGAPQQPGGEIRPGTRQETRIMNQSAEHLENCNTNPAETRNSTRIMHLSDIHLGHFRGKAFLSRLVALTAAESPDLVVITGDLFDGRRQLHSETLEPLKQLDVPLFFVEGNHDGYTGVERVKALVRGAGVRVLENEVVDAGGLQLVGLNHMPADDGAPSMHAGENKGTIRAVLDTLEIDPALPSVLLHHSPDGIEFAVKKGIGLYLTGHTHGGQLFPVNFINDLLFQFNRGLTNHNGTRIFVSKGAGTFGPPLRVGTRGEITLIELLIFPRS